MNYQFLKYQKKLDISYNRISAIQQKRVYNDISDQYNIKERKIASNLSVDEVEKICQYFEQNSIKPEIWTYDQYYENALISIGAKVTTLTKRSVEKIYKKQTYSYISKNYNF